MRDPLKGSNFSSFILKGWFKRNKLKRLNFSSFKRMIFKRMILKRMILKETKK